MAGHLPQLDRAALRRIREMVKALRRAPRHSMPTRVLLNLASSAPSGTGLTIDLEASRDFGDPLIIVRIAADDRDVRPDSRLMALSRREREVSELVAKGFSNRRIADHLCIATSTVKDHLHNILQKTELPNRAALAAACRGPVETLDEVCHRPVR